MLKLNKKLFLFLPKLLFFLAVFVFSSSFASAAELTLSPSSGSYGVGDTINVRLVLSSAQSANAISGSLSFSKDKLTLSSISKSNSLISLWAQEPSYSNASGTANMEGVILSGYTGNNGTIVTLVFKAKSTGNANVKFASSSVLANDGEGTNIGAGVGQANFTIGKAKEQVVDTTKKSTPSITIEELKKKNELDVSTKFIVTSVGKKNKSVYKVEIDGIAYPWVDQGSDIFETTPLVRGAHTIKVYMETIDGDVISSSTSFTINSILTPVFTDYSKDIKENEYIVVKGIADPNIDVVLGTKAILTTTNQVFVQEAAVRSDDKGLFVYVSDKALPGVYDITAYARTKGGVESEKTSAIIINVLPKSAPILSRILNTFSLLVPIVGLIITLIILTIWGWYKVLYFQAIMRRRLTRIKNLVAKSFGILNEDVAEELKVFKKIRGLQPITKEERLFINQFKKDIEAAEKAIIDDIT